MAGGSAGMQGDLPMPALNEMGDDALQRILRHEDEEVRELVQGLAPVAERPQLSLPDKGC